MSKMREKKKRYSLFLAVIRFHKQLYHRNQTMDKGILNSKYIIELKHFRLKR